MDFSGAVTEVTCSHLRLCLGFQPENAARDLAAAEYAPRTSYDAKEGDVLFY